MPAVGATDIQAEFDALIAGRAGRSPGVAHAAVGDDVEAQIAGLHGAYGSGAETGLGGSLEGELAEALRDLKQTQAARPNNTFNMDITVGAGASPDIADEIGREIERVTRRASVESGLAESDDAF